ncbi:hypothetical protein JHK87_006383 [Glycine soja]|nr:hypothetical protein JHK87_006383 [Glycine soja]
MEGSQLTPALVNVLVATPASRGPKRMHCVMDSIPATAIETGDVAPTQTDNNKSTTALAQQHDDDGASKNDCDRRYCV